MKFIKRPVAIEAIEWTGDNFHEVDSFTKRTNVDLDGGKRLHIRTLEGVMLATIGDMVIKGVKGEYYSCKPDIFKLTYFTEQEYAQSKEL